MHRTIAAAALVFAFAAFALHESTLVSPLAEPLLLLVMGSLFLVLGKFFTPSDHQTGPQLAPQQQPQQQRTA